MVQRGTEIPELKNLIRLLEEASRKSKAPIWKAVAYSLSVPTRKRTEVNLNKISRFAKDGQTILVPGKVLGIGELNKKVSIAAYSFSKGAAEKIAKAGGKALHIKEMVAKNPQGSGIVIMK